MRSLLLVPADSPGRLAEALASGADVLIVDLGESVATGAKAVARAAAREFLVATARMPDAPRLFVRINALDSGLADADLDAVMATAPEAIVLPKAAAGADVQHLGVKLAVREAENGLADGGTGILVTAGETAASIFAMGTYAGASRRLIGLAWDAKHLATDLGAQATRLDDGAFTPPMNLARTLALFAAAAAGVAAVDAIDPKINDTAHLRAECAAARRDGFVAKLAIDPRQVPIINESFTPSPAAIAEARAIVAAFAADPDAFVVTIGSDLFDRGCLRRAERLLARAASSKG